MSEQLQEGLYFDPFAEAGQELFDPLEAFALIETQYQEGRVAHDYSADSFVAQTEALMMDAVFIERFDAVQAIASRMHQLCGEDHSLGQAVLRNAGLFGATEHSEDDGHGHENMSKSHDHSDDDDEIDPKTGKKKKKRNKK